MLRLGKVAICTDLPFRYDAVYPEFMRKELEELADLYPGMVTTEIIRSGKTDLSSIEVIFGTWGITAFTEEDLDQLPSLKAVFYAAGSVQPFAQNLFRRGIKVFSARRINAQPVSEFTLAHILLACKGYFRNVEALRQPDARDWRGDSPVGPGIYNQRIGIVGCGAIGSRVLKLLEPFNLIAESLDSYPTIDMEQLREMFKGSHVISNHLADKPHLRGIYTADLFAMMPEGATFINTGRGAQVMEEDLVSVLRERPDLTAILDVTDPEPPAMNSALRTLSNVHLSAHISGSINHETQRMACCMIEEFKRWCSGQPLEHEVNLRELSLIA